MAEANIMKWSKLTSPVIRHANIMFLLTKMHWEGIKTRRWHLLLLIGKMRGTSNQKNHQILIWLFSCYVTFAFKAVSWEIHLYICSNSTPTFSGAYLQTPRSNLPSVGNSLTEVIASLAETECNCLSGPLHPTPAPQITADG